MSQLLDLEEDWFLEGFHQQVQKTREKALHDQHIKQKKFQEGDIVLLYDIKFFKFLGKFKTHWLSPYVIKYIIDGGATHLSKLNGELIQGIVNGSRLKLYRDNLVPITLPKEEIR